jgi:pimeloyl-ACP methyl ester carboxylesterase
VLCTLLSVQGVAAILLSYRLFLRVSPMLQMLAFFLLLAGYFLTPGTVDLHITTAHGQEMMSRLPSYWFVGLFQLSNGVRDPVFTALARQAMMSLSLAAAVAAVAFTLAYTRQIRRMIEQPDITPGDRTRPAARVLRWLAGKVVTKPLDRALLLFTARTLVRSRQHRIILAAYAGIGLAIAVTYCRSLLYGYSLVSIRQPNVPLTAAGFVLLFFMLVGMRATFALPTALKANWIFRITAVHSPKAYYTAIRKTLLALGAVPVWIVATMVYVALWPFVPALGHVAVLVMAGVLLASRLLLEFRKVPFACSYLPGKANLKFKLGAYGILFLAFTDAAARMTPWMLRTSGRAMFLFLILSALLLRALLRWRTFAHSPYGVLQFEDLDIPEVSPLDLRADGAYARPEQYLDVINVQSKPPLPQRMKAALRYGMVATAVVAITGFAYEQGSEWRDRKRFPPPGQMVNIGTRSLHLYCTGEGQPTVVFESGANSPGYIWVLVQRQVAQFARACWYDRAGFGWSDASPGERTAGDIADDLHLLLQRARMPGPYVLVAHSAGGFSARVYAAKHPKEVAGMVLAEPADEYADLNPSPDRKTALSFLLPPFVLRCVVVLINGVANMGWARLLDEDGVVGPGAFSIEDSRILRALRLQVKSIAATPNESLRREETVAQVQAVRSLGDLPLIVVSGGKSAPNPDLAGARKDFGYKWVYEIHPRIARLSSRGRHAIAVNSGHGIPVEEPEAIVEAVRDVVNGIRAYRAP